MDELTMNVLDKKIEKLQEKVGAKHREYNELLKELSDLLDQRYPERTQERIKDALYESYQNSGRSIEEIIYLIEHADEWI